MRPIKFRSWDKDKKQMLSDVTATPQGNILVFGGWIKVGQMGTSRRNLYELKNGELMQFTGLLDKNGKEIYEGDIVRCRLFNGDNHTFNYEVRFEDGAFKAHGYKLTNNDQIEIIGNIYENPELLKATP